MAAGDVWGNSWGASWGTSWAQAVAAAVETVDVTFYATNRHRQKLERLQLFEGGSLTVAFDFSAWAEDNGTVTAVAWRVQEGGVLLASDSLSSNVSQIQITAPQYGRSLIKVTATSGSDLDVRYIDVMTRSLGNPSDDYGLFRN